MEMMFTCYRLLTEDDDKRVIRADGRRARETSCLRSLERKILFRTCLALVLLSSLKLFIYLGKPLPKAARIGTPCSFVSCPSQPHHPGHTVIGLLWPGHEMP